MTQLHHCQLLASCRACSLAQLQRWKLSFALYGTSCVLIQDRVDDAHLSSGKTPKTANRSLGRTKLLFICQSLKLKLQSFNTSLYRR